MSKAKKKIVKPTEPRTPELEAIERVSAMFGDSELELERAEWYRGRVEKQQREVESQLQTAVQVQLDKIRTAQTQLQATSSTVAEVRKSFYKIDELCKSNKNLIPDYDLIRMLAVARMNVNAVITDSRKLLQIPDKIREIKELLKEDANILKAYREIRAMERLKSNILDESRGLRQEFEQLKQQTAVIDTLRALLEPQLFAIFHKCFEVGVSRPATLVKALQIVENEEALDKKKLQTARALGRDEALADVKAYKVKALDQIRQWIFKDFDYTFADLENEIHESFDPNFELSSDTTNRLLSDAEDKFSDLHRFQKSAAPCFPPEYEIMAYVVREYHKRYHHLIMRFANIGTSLSARDTVSLVKWVKCNYEMMLEQFGIKEIDPSLIEPLTDLIATYRQHIKNLMKEWTPRIIDVDKKTPPEEIQGLLCTDAPLTLFKIIQDQIAVGKSTNYRKFIFEIAIECCLCLLAYQEYQIRVFKEEAKELELDYVIAQINNNRRCADLGEEMIGKIGQLLSDKQMAQLNFDRAIEGFRNLSTKAIETIVTMIFYDVSSVFDKICTKEWETGDFLIDSVTDTFKDYFQNDIHGVIPDFYYTRLLEETLDRIVEAYVQEMFQLKNKSRTVDPSAIVRYRYEIDHLRVFFSVDLRDTLVEEKLRVLTVVTDMFEASPEKFETVFIEVLKFKNVVPLRDIEANINRRLEFNKQQNKQCVEIAKRLIK